MATKLPEMTRALEALARGQKLRTPENVEQAHVDAIVDAIRNVRVTLNEQRGYDYTPEFAALGKAVAAAVEAHGDLIEKAIAGVQINVAAPNVVVEAVLPETPPIVVEVIRDEHEKMKFLKFRTEIPVQESTEPAVDYE